MAVLARLGAANWADGIDKLRNAGANWLPDGLEVPLEQRIVAKLRTAITDGLLKLPPDWRYRPWMIEPLLADVAAILDRALGYRREIADLEIRAVKDALDFRDYANFVARDKDIVDASSQAPYAQDNGDALSKAADVAGKPQEPLLSTLKVLLGGLTTSQKNLVQAENFRVQKMKDRIAAGTDTMTQLEQAHSELGNSYNFSDRAKRMERLLSEDLIESVEKAHCAWSGLQVMYPKAVKNAGNTQPGQIVIDVPPDPRKESWVWSESGEACASYVDALLSWTRQAMRAIEYRTQFEREYDVLIPLTQEWCAVAALMDKATMQATLRRPDTINITVGPERFPAGTGRRLIGLGLHYMGLGGSPGPILRMTATLQPPEQPYGNVNIPVPSMSFGHVRDILWSADLDLAGLGSQSNINPEGTWHLSAKKFWGTALTAGDAVNDMIIVMRIRHEPT